MEQQTLLTREEVASLLQISTETVSRYVRQGMPHFRAPDGRTLRFDKTAVLSWLSTDPQPAAANQ